MVNIINLTQVEEGNNKGKNSNHWKLKPIKEERISIGKTDSLKIFEQWQEDLGKKGRDLNKTT